MWLTRACFLQGHCGPLCGSCVSSYGSSLSSRCRKCRPVVGDVAVICVSVLVLAALSCVTIRGNLTVAKEKQTTLSSKDSTAHCIEMSPVASSNRKSRRRKARSPVDRRDDSAKNEQAEGLPATEKTLALWKTVEMFKVRHSAERLILTNCLADHTELPELDGASRLSGRWMGDFCPHHGRNRRYTCLCRIVSDPSLCRSIQSSSVDSP